MFYVCCIFIVCLRRSSSHHHLLPRILAPFLTLRCTPSTINRPLVWPPDRPSVHPPLLRCTLPTPNPETKKTPKKNLDVCISPAPVIVSPPVVLLRVSICPRRPLLAAVCIAFGPCILPPPPPIPRTLRLIYSSLSPPPPWLLLFPGYPGCPGCSFGPRASSIDSSSFLLFPSFSLQIHTYIRRHLSSSRPRNK